MRALFLAVCATGAVATPSLADEPKQSPRGKLTIPTLMRETHMRGRQVYRSLDQLLVSGRSTADERKRFVENYTKMREMKPPQGTVESWQYDLDRIIGIVKEMDAAKDEETMLAAGTKLFYATNCNACH